MPHLRRNAVMLALALACASAQALEPQAYALDPVHTRVLFAVEHAGFSQALGTISGSSGSLLFDPDDWSSARLDVSVPLTQLELGDAKWNAATLGANLLDAERYPHARFVSSSVELIDPQPADSTPAGSQQPSSQQASPQHARPKQARVCGELTLRDVTRPLCLEVTFNALQRHPLPPFRHTAGFSATATLSRSEYGIDAWKSVIGDRVELRIEAEAVRDDDAAAAFAPSATDEPAPASTTESDKPEQTPPTPEPIP